MTIVIEDNEKSIGDDLYKQLLSVGSIIIYIRFIKDRSILISLLNIINFSIISLINQILDNQYNVEEIDEEEDTGDIIHKTVNKLFSNLQNLIVVQVFYSIWYHYNYKISFQESKIHYYQTIFLFLIDDQFPLNPSPIFFFFLLDTMLLLIQLIMINIQLKRLHREHTVRNNSNDGNNTDTIRNNDTVIGFLTNEYDEDSITTGETRLNDETQPLITDTNSQGQENNTTNSSILDLGARDNNEPYYDSTTTTTRSTTFEPLVT